MFKYIYLIFISLFSFSFQSCSQGKNFCVLCELYTDLCKKCESDLFKPDLKGGCEGAKKCIKDYNYCLECSSTNYTCDKCVEDYYPDNNGGCAKIENCEVSENGECKMCIENYALIYQGQPYLECVSMDTEELLNCEEYDIYGHCLKCKENYYMNAGDEKCSNTENCFNSTKGICQICEYDFYLDKSNATNYLCLSNNEKNVFWKCILSNDGINCDECLSPYFLSKNKICVESQFCEEGETGLGKCSKCLDNLYLTEDKYSCTTSDFCINGYNYNTKCRTCKKGYYLDLIDGNCYSNQEDNDEKYCLTVAEKCESCIDDYYLSEDKKCTSSKNCLVSSLGNCTKCINNYHLGIDNKCTNITYCIKSNFNYFCEECEKGYFVYHDVNCVNDDKSGNIFKNCKIVYYGVEHCSACKNGFYLDESDYLCYSNDESASDEFYKCSYVIENSEGKKECNECESPYYLGGDYKCSKIPGCAESQSLDVCTKCMPGWCKNLNRNLKCQPNSFLDKDENNEVCYKCLETNMGGTRCNICEEGYVKNSKGYCIDESLCDIIDGSECIQCKQKLEIDESLKSYCLNPQYGCLESIEGCLKCNDFYNPEICNECLNGYYLDPDYQFCYECTEGCNSCTDSINCKGCKEDQGYYTNKEESSPDAYDAECAKCGEGCKTCTNDVDCEICFDGYFLNNNNEEKIMKCSQCSTWCEQCLDESYCLKCNEGYHLVLNGDKVICEYQKKS